MKKIKVFSLVAFVPWLCFAYLLFICNSCTDECGEGGSVFNYSRIDFGIIDADTKEDLIQGIRPGGIYPNNQVKVVLDHGELAKDYEMGIGDQAHFTFADSSDLDALDNMKTKLFYLNLVDNLGNVDVDTIKVDFKYKISECKIPDAEKITVSFNDKVYYKNYSIGTIIFFQKKR